MRPTIAFAAIATTILLTGCGLDALEGKKSSAQVAEERRAALTLPMPAAVPVVPTPTVQPIAVPAPAVQPEPVPAAQVAAIAPEPLPVVPPAPAVCQAIFRVLSCGDAGEWLWL